MYVRVAGPMGCTHHLISLCRPMETSMFVVLKGFCCLCLTINIALKAPMDDVTSWSLRLCLTLELMRSMFDVAWLVVVSMSDDVACALAHEVDLVNLLSSSSNYHILSMFDVSSWMLHLCLASLACARWLVCRALAHKALLTTLLSLSPLLLSSSPLRNMMWTYRMVVPSLSLLPLSLLPPCDMTWTCSALAYEALLLSP